MKTKNKAAIRIRKRLRKLGLIPCFVLLTVLGGCATVPSAPCTCAPLSLKPAPTFVSPATLFISWDLLDAQEAAGDAARGVDDTEIAREAQAAFQINELQSELDGLVRP